MCDASYVMPADLNCHKKRVHNQDKYTCSFCNRSYCTAYSLKKHLNYVHIKGRTFACNECSKKFKKNIELRAHIRHKHPGKGRYYCDICEKDFKCSTVLISHNRIKHKR